MSQRSGQITITGVTQFPDIHGIAAGIKAHPDNTDTIWIGNDGSDTISSGTGFPLNAGETIIVILEYENLNTLYTVADVADEKVCWILADA